MSSWKCWTDIYIYIYRLKLGIWVWLNCEVCCMAFNDPVDIFFPIVTIKNSIFIVIFYRLFNYRPRHQSILIRFLLTEEKLPNKRWDFFFSSFETRWKWPIWFNCYKKTHSCRRAQPRRNKWSSKSEKILSQQQTKIMIFTWPNIFRLARGERETEGGGGGGRGQKIGSNELRFEVKSSASERNIEE